MTNKTLTLTAPDDWHLHLRDGDMLQAVLAPSAARFDRALAMPNLQPPITTVAAAGQYRTRILSALPDGAAFRPLIALYLTDNTTAAEVERAAASDFIPAFKLYPAGATTNSGAGVTALEKIFPVLEKICRHELVLCVHGEATDPAVDVFDREQVFIEQTLAPLMERLPDLRIVFEHITTREAVAFVRGSADNLAATITPQHLLLSRNALFQGGLRPHHYCLPVLKRETHRQALLDAATSGEARFFLGTDSAPHSQQAKESACGCAGCYSAPAAIELYAEVFDQAGALARLEAFASLHGAAFYRLAPNQRKITLVRQDWQVPAHYPLPSGERLIPLYAGQTLHWQLSTHGECP